MAAKEHTIQTVVVLNCSETQTTANLVQTFLGRAELVEKTIHTEENCDVIRYPWHLNTKYYEAEINFIDSKDLVHLIGSDSQVKNEAIIAYSDNLSETTFKQIQAETEHLKNLDVEVRILCCQSFTDHDERFEAVQKWCIANEYELIELEPRDEDPDDCDVQSSQRLMDALEAHTWPVMALKAKHGVPSETVDLDRLAINANDENEPNFDGELTETQEEEFERLFSQLEMMKVKAAELSEDVRKTFAEETVLAFWNAIGNDEADTN